MTSHFPTDLGFQQQMPVGHTASVRRMLHSLVTSIQIADAETQVPWVRSDTMKIVLGLQEAVVAVVLVSSCSIGRLTFDSLMLLSLEALLQS